MAPPPHFFPRTGTLLALLALASCSLPQDDAATPAGDSTTAPTVDTTARRTKRDADGDGYLRSPWGKDCNDSNKAVHPGATETCATTYDDDCDTVANEKNATSCTTFYADADHDGYGSATSSACYCSATSTYTVTNNTDCNDASASVSPGATEIAGDGIDQNCDGVDSSGGGGTSTGDAPLYGFWGLDGYNNASGFADVKSRMGVTVFQAACADANYCVKTYLPMIKAAGMKVTFRMTQGNEYYTTSGNFDIAKWKAKLLTWKDSGVQAYIDDGTLAGHMMLDDIRTFSGKDPTAAELDEMARYSKELFPGLMTFVREQATDMPTPSSGKYVYVDACVNQYLSIRGDVYTYADTEEAKAISLGLGVINGLNIDDGGDGSSGQSGWRSGYYAMSAAEITEYGDALAAVPSMGMFLMWEYDGNEAWPDGTIGADYFNQPDLQAAFKDLAVVVASHPHVELLKP